MKILGLSLFLFSSIGFGWGDLGHQTVAEIAERNLTPQARKAITNIVGPEALAIMATWPDAVRSDSKFNPLKEYHFVEIEPGKTYETSTHPTHDAYTVISKFPGLVSDPKNSQVVKMIALRYLIHVVGDVHQPLHVGNGLDMGANLCDVNWHPANGVAMKTNLHTIWDETLVIYDETKYKAASPEIKYYGYSEFASAIIKNNPLSVSEIASIQAAKPLEWFSESALIRSTKVYPDLAIHDSPFKDNERPYCKILQDGKVVNGAYDPEKIPVIGETYADAASPIVEKRILAGGLRLAALLNDLFKDSIGGEENSDIFGKLLFEDPR